LSEIRHQVTQDAQRNVVVISALTTSDCRVLVETQTLPFTNIAALDRTALTQRVESAARMNEERIKKRS
jgi:hypothetical protein